MEQHTSIPIISQVVVRFTITLLLAIYCFIAQAQPPVSRNGEMLPDSVYRKRPLRASPGGRWVTSGPSALQPLPYTLNAQTYERPGRSTDTCETYTYRLQAGNPGITESVSQVQSIFSTGETLVIGSVSGAADSDGLLMKLDRDGRLVWSKKYGAAGRNERFTAMQVTRDGGIIITGSDEGGGNSQMLICRLDQQGNVLWANSLNTAIATQLRGVDIIESADENSFVFAGDNGSLIFYGKLSAAGALLLQKSIRPAQAGNRVIGLRQDFFGWYIAGTGRDSGYQISYVTTINKTNGNINYHDKFGGPASGMDVWFHHLEMNNDRPIITGIYRSGNVNKFFRTYVYPGSDITQFEEFLIGTNVYDTTGSSRLSRWGELMAVSTRDTALTWSVCKSVQDGPFRWARQYNLPASCVLRSITRTHDGGFLLAGDLPAAGNTSDIFLMKTDSAGNTPGCSNTPVSGSKFFSNPRILHLPLPQLTDVLSISLVSLSTPNQPIDTLYQCRQLFCPTLPVNDTCLATFYKRYRGPDFCDLGRMITELPDSSLLASGGMRINPYEPSDDQGTLIKFNRNGDIIQKARVFTGNSNANAIVKHLVLRDGNILTLNVGTENKIWIEKMTSDFTNIWRKAYLQGVSNGSVTDIIEASDGNLFMLAYTYLFPVMDTIHLIKLDAAGNLLWDKTFYGTSSIFLQTYGVLEEGANAIFCTAVYTSGNGQERSLLLKVNAQNGNLIFARDYFNTNPNSRTNLAQHIRVRNNNLYLLGIADAVPSTDALALRCDLDGNIVRAVSLGTNIFYNIPQLIKNTDNRILIGNYHFDLTVNPFRRYNDFIELDSALNFRRALKRELTDAAGGEIIQARSGNFYELGTGGYPEVYNVDIFLRKLLPNGELVSCPSLDFPLQPTSYPLTSSVAPIITGNAQLYSPTALNVSLIPYRLNTNSVLCSSPPDCDTLRLTGDTLVCSNGNTLYTYHAFRNPGCTAPVNWTVAGNNYQLVATTDSSITLRFSANGAVVIRGSLSSACRLYRDSLRVQVRNSPGPFSLGADSVLCNNVNRILRVPKGFASYLWQDGSTDSTLTVSAPGQYHITATDSCGNQYRDTVEVLPDQLIPFSAGPDRIKCNSDSVTLSATPGLTDYAWQPAYNITALTAQTTIVFPFTDTAYRVQARKPNGCIIRDTVRITVRSSPPVLLGRDTSFCTGNSIVLNAGPGFVTYTWSTGAATQQITVNTPGTYSVVATAANTCLSRDTLTVQNVYTLPVIGLGPDTAICRGTTFRIDAGNFAAYRWQDGTTSRIYPASLPGIYWVEVTDGNGCRNRDSLEIVRLKELPANFLPDTASLCEGEAITIQALSPFRSYLWNTGNITPAITASRAGIYWLEVLNTEGCRNRDSIRLFYKECDKGIYFPSGFTPNADGFNDTFKPIVFGVPVYFYLVVYNRWGQKVFETYDWRKGWNGRIGGRDQDNGGFVWQCTYQFKNGTLQMQKGSAILIR